MGREFRNAKDVSRSTGDHLAQLNQAKWILIGIGFLTIALNIYDIYYIGSGKAHEAVDKELRNAGVRREQLFGEMKEKVDRVYLILDNGILLDSMFVLAGLGMILLGVVIRKKPVPAAALGLVLYVSAQAVFIGILMYLGLGDQIIKGIFIKIAIIFGLVSALNAAIKYQRAMDKDKLSQSELDEESLEEESSPRRSRSDDSDKSEGPFRGTQEDDEYRPRRSV